MCLTLQGYSGPLMAVEQMQKTHMSCWSYSTERTDHTQTQAPKTEKSKAHINLIWTSFLQPEREREGETLTSVFAQKLITPGLF